MNIVKSDADSRLEQIQNNRDFISSVLNEIFLICKVDDSFIEVGDKIKEMSEEVNLVKEKLEKQDQLLSESTQLKIDVEKKIQILDKENSRIRKELLTKLGSE